MVARLVYDFQICKLQPGKPTAGMAVRFFGRKCGADQNKTKGVVEATLLGRKRELRGATLLRRRQRRRCGNSAAAPTELRLPQHLRCVPSRPIPFRPVPTAASHAAAPPPATHRPARAAFNPFPER